MSKNKFILSMLAFSMVFTIFANNQVAEYTDIQSAQSQNYTQQQLAQKNALYQSQGAESTALITPVISASELVNQIDTDQLYNKKAIKQFMYSFNLYAITNIKQASDLILQATALIKSTISIEQLTSIVNLCDSVITYSADKGFKSLSFSDINQFINSNNVTSFGGYTADGKFFSAGTLTADGKFVFSAQGFDSLQSFISSNNFTSFGGFKADGSFVSAGSIFNADKILLSVGKLWDVQTFEVQKLQKLISLQDKLFDYILKNNISFSYDVSKLLAEKLANITEQIPQLTKVLDKDNQLVGWAVQNLQDYYLANAKDFREFDAVKWKKWKQIVQNPMADVAKNNYKVPNGRFMFEVWTPQTEQQRLNLQKQLDFVKKNGYIGVVVIWDGEKDYNKLIDVQEMILNKGFKIWLAFSTQKEDRLDKTTFVQPQYYYQGLKALAKRSQAFLMGWRRTSIHLNRQVKGWQNYTMNALRQGNPNIGFIGQAYFGYNGTHSPNEYHLYFNYRQNYNAILAVNFGFVSVNPNWALNKLKSSLGVQDMQYVCLIQGVTALYLKDYPGKKKRTRAQYRRINQLLEKRFLRAGFSAVAGMSGDGVNRINAQDDMCVSKNHVPSSQKF